MPQRDNLQKDNLQNRNTQARTKNESWGVLFKGSLYSKKA